MMKRHYSLLIVISLTLCLGCQKKNDWVPIYKNDKEGNAVLGSKKELINAIRNGNEIRIAWGSKGKTHRIEHISDPTWIAILDETEVIAHIDPQVLSSVDWDTLTADYADSTKLSQEWRVVITTKGDFDAVWYDRENHKVLQRRPQNHVMTWFVKGEIADNVVPFYQQ